MLKKNKFLKIFLFVFPFLLLVACEKEVTTQKSQEQVTQTTSTENVRDNNLKENITTSKVEEISWDKLIPAGYDPEEAIGKYMKQLDKLQDNDQEAVVIYGKIQAELDNAPVNMALDGKNIKIPGFVAPLENDNSVINEFLLVPYFGACIHTPPPPMNQTVMIKAKKGQGVKSEDSYLPVWVTGTLKAVEERTKIGAAGYRIENAVVEPYEDE